MPIFARVLKDRGLITERQLQEAVQHQVLYGGRLGTSLYELGFITEHGLREALARSHGVPTVHIKPEEISPAVVKLISKTLASKYKIFPYKVRRKTLFLLMVDPQDHMALARVGFSLGYVVRPLVVPEFRMIDLLRDFYGVDEHWRYEDTFRPARLPPRPPDKDAATARLEKATSRDEVVEAAVALCLHYFRRVVFFIVRDPWVFGWTGRGEGMDRSLARSFKFPLGAPSIFRTASRNKTLFVGRLGAGTENDRFVKALAKRSQSNAVLLPILLQGRVVNLIYGDNGSSGNVKASLGDLLARIQKVSQAYRRIIQQRIEAAQEATRGPARDVPG